jgi:hypothetical protein
VDTKKGTAQYMIVNFGIDQYYGNVNPAVVTRKQNTQSHGLSNMEGKKRFKNIVVFCRSIKKLYF